MKRTLTFFTALLVTLPLVAETITYKTLSEGKTTIQTGTVSVIQDGELKWTTTVAPESTMRAARNREGTLVAVEVVTKKSEWSLRVAEDLLTGSGTVENKPVAGTLPLKNRLWAVGFDQPLRWVVTKKIPDTFTFLMVNPSDLAKPQEMTISPDGKETIEGKTALRYKLGLPGALALFWSATVWADPVTGEQVQYRGTRGPGTPEMVITTTRSQNTN